MTSLENKAQTSRRAILENIGYHIVRIILFAGALVFAVFGLVMLSNASNSQATTETVTEAVVKEEPVGHALVLLSHGDYDPDAIYERAGIIDVLTRASVAYSVEYLDADCLSASTEEGAAWQEALTEKIAAYSYDVVICTDDAALQFLQEKHASLFPEVPVVFCGVFDADLADQTHREGWASGSVLSDFSADVMRANAALLPNASKFLAISDDTVAGKYLSSQFQNAQSDFPGFSFETVNAGEMTRDQLRQKLSAVDESTVVLLLSAREDSTGKMYSVDDGARFVSDACPRPVFSITNGVGEGICGSGFVDREKAGEDAATMAVEVLNGSSPGTIDIVSDAADGYVYDSKVLEKYGLDKTAIPSTASLINNQSFSFQSIRPLIVPILLILAAVALILVFALMGYRRSVKSTREIIESRNDLQYRLYHNALTNLYNRAALNSFSESSKFENSLKSLVHIDLDDFNDINDTYGHAFGDKMLVQVAERLRGIDAPLTIHMSGDEFLLGYESKIGKNSKLLQHISEVLDEPMNIDDVRLEPSACIGVVNRSANMDIDAMVAAADLATRNAKETAGKHDIAFYDRAMKDRMEEQIQITQCLKDSIADEKIVVLFQPQVDAQSLDVHGYEALVRLEGDPYYPGQFIPVAEKSGMVQDLDRLVTKIVIRQLGIWKKRHKRLRPVSINYSAEQLEDTGYVDFLAQQLRENDVPADLVRIEITESMQLEDKRAQKLFADLTKLGIELSLDDFGTGYSSLERLATMPTSEVKLDKTLVDAILVPETERFIFDIVQMIHGLDKFIVVEGVETRAQLEMCRKLNCDVIQGYYFSRPVRAEEAVSFKAVLK